MRRRLLLVFALGVIAAALTPAPALAHGFHGGGATSVPDFLWLGIRHMLGGWDHLLFITGIVVLAREVSGAAKLISLFVAGHSTTLLVATLAGWQLNAASVDVVIALSVAYIGLRVLRGRPRRWGPTALAIFGFGLVHGLGLATRLQGLALPDGWPLAGRVLAFNVGVEIGQLLALTAIVGTGLVALRLSPRLAHQRAVLGRGLIAFGAITAALLAFVAARDAGTADARGPSAASGCTEQSYDYTPKAAGRSAGHPRSAFYPPGQAPSRADLEHVMADGYVVIVYRKTIPRQARDALARWVDGVPWGAVVVPGTVEAPYALEALTYQRRLTCDRVNVTELAGFRDRWLRRT